MHIYIASDHAGFELKSQVQTLLKQFEWKDLGPTSLASCDYPLYAQKVAEQVRASGYQSPGVLICGSGIGMSIAANKIDGIRAAHVTNPIEARLAREHNQAQIICLGSRFLAREYAAELIQIFLSIPLTVGEQVEPGSPMSRHLKRIEQIAAMEREQNT